MNEEERTYDEYFEMREPVADDDGEMDERMYVPREDLLDRHETDKEFVINVVNPFRQHN
jgi:hypothetical protein